MSGALITAPSPSRPTVPSSGLSVGGSQVHSASAQAPALTLPGSLSFAGDLLLLFTAFHILLFINYTVDSQKMSRGSAFRTYRHKAGLPSLNVLLLASSAEDDGAQGQSQKCGAYQPAAVLE